MADCVIFSSRPISVSMLKYVPPDAFFIAADAGWLQMRQLGLTPHLALGDFDSAPPPEMAGTEIRQLPTAKDDTDTHAAAREALRRGFKNITILGGLGGRMDHSLANLQTLLFLARSGAQNLLAGEQSEWRCMEAGTLRLAAKPGALLSVFAAGGPAMGVCLKGLRYPLKDATLLPDFPIGISNEFIAEDAEISCMIGNLYVVTMNDRAEYA